MMTTKMMKRRMKMRRIIKLDGKKIKTLFTDLHNRIFNPLEARTPGQKVEEIIIPKDLLQQVEQALKSQYAETTVFLFGKEKRGKLLCTDKLIPGERDYESRSLGHVYVSKEFVVREFPKLEKSGKTLLATIHSHPMDVLSHGDVATHLKVIKHYPHQLSGIYNSGRLFFYKWSGNGMKLTPRRVVDLSRFDRQIRAFGIEGQMLISSSTIALIGVGGGNARIAFDLASLGVGRIILVDPDNWEEHNRNRVFLPSGLCGRNKAKSIKNLIELYYDDVEVDAFPLRAEEVSDEVYEQADVIIVGPDTLSTRIFGNRLALRLKKPAVFPAAGIESKDGKLSIVGGSVQVVVPGKTPCYECVSSISQLDLDRETMDPEVKRKLSERYGLGDALEIPVAPAIASLNSLIEGAALWEVIKLITGVEPITEYQVYDALKPELKRIAISRKPNCPACSPGEAPEVQTQSDELVLSTARGREEK
jgi:molybdopterin/thiamine biosynthesis adenylyltransferase